MEDSSENSLETDRKEYDNNRRSEKAKRLEDRIVKQKEKKFLQKVQIPQYIYNSLTTGADKFQKIYRSGKNNSEDTSYQEKEEGSRHPTLRAKKEKELQEIF